MKLNAPHCGSPEEKKGVRTQRHNVVSTSTELQMICMWNFTNPNSKFISSLHLVTFHVFKKRAQCCIVASCLVGIRINFQLFTAHHTTYQDLKFSSSKIRHSTI
jgi:hypothetical protein